MTLDRPRPRRRCTPSAPPSSRAGPTAPPLDAAVARLRSVPPLVFAGECDELKDKLAAVARGEAFLLQGGDCAETFDGVTADNVRNKLRVLLQMAVVLTYAASVPVVKVGRLAGQYAKPRSSDTETRDGVTLPAYRGDAVNGFDFTPESRVPDPQRLRRRLPLLGRDAEPRARVRHRRLRRPAPGARLEHRLRARPRRSAGATSSSAGEIDRALTFMQAIGADPDEFHRVDFHSSHEALILEYEHALTRIDSRTEPPYDVSGALRVDRRADPPARRRARRAAVATSATRSASSSARPPRADDAIALAAASSTRTTSRAGSRSSPGWAPAGSATALPDARREGHRRRASRSRGSATRCTATPSRRRRATRPAASTT